ncbi:hypothetical protein PsYK624_111010 [Phanerochaete sordida]|uniref:Uncharacterized protein n=1 Tax=Phanerochaete sordida TaxID=48140 RepID=A0A9P3GH62_9APHY|nr:hypothetical protein PsYK624_111010 [Phanerochaete sordida]
MPKTRSASKPALHTQPVPIYTDTEPPVEDESTWRKSTVDVHQTITRGAALKLYRLNADDLDGLEHETERKRCPTSGRLLTVTTSLYSERKVERLAWQKHGGPARFEAYLAMLKARHAARDDYRGAFPAPAAYLSRLSRTTTATTTSAADTANAHSLATTLDALQKQFPARQWGPYTAALDGLGALPARTREKALRAALPVVRAYPACPPGRFKCSPPWWRLCQTLRRAPAAGPGRKDVRAERDAEGGVRYYWDDGYMVEVLEALIAFVEYHGVGGWERAARWAVYNWYASRMYGVSYDVETNKWKDGAFEWLCGRLDHRPSFLPTQACESFPTWERYNNLLPTLDPNEKAFR